jgi:hypothetical protein
MQSFEELGVQTFVTDGRTFRNQYVSPEHVRSWYGITTPFFKLSAYIFIFNEILYYLLSLSFIYSVRVHISIPGADPGGRTGGRTPKIGKNMIFFGVKS